MSTSAGPLHYRQARIGDESIVLELMRAFYAEEHLVFDERIAQRAVDELLAHPEFGVIFLLEAAGAVVGLLTLTYGFSLEFHGRYALLDELYLIPDARGRGWSQTCLQLAATTAREQGMAALRLEVNHANTHARATYQKRGFQNDHRDLFTHWL